MRRPSDWVKVAAVAAVYVGAAKLGIEMDVAHGVITPVWAPTGISLAALVLLGIRFWPGVALGAFVANVTSDVSVVLAAAIAVGNTLEAVVGAYLLRRVGFDGRLERVRDVLALVVLGAFVSTTISATNGVTALTLGGVVDASGYGEAWLLWWFGDVIGNLVVAPVLLTWLSPRPSPRLPGAPLEALLIAALLIGLSLTVFLGGNWKYPYVLFPLLVWATLRFRQTGATTAVFIVAAIGTWGTVQGAVPIGGATATQSVQILQGLIAIVGVSLFIMAATLESEHQTAELLRRNHELQNTFMSAVSHDLRSPIATIIGLASVLKANWSALGEKDIRDAINGIGVKGEHASQMLSNLLDTDRVARGAIELRRTDTDLLQMLIRTLRALEVEDRVEVSGSPLIVPVDHVLVERIIENLLLNAVRHTPADTPVWARVEATGDGALLIVEDAGPGVHDSFKTVIFQPFEQGRGGQGSGLGLYLVARFAEMHGGRAWVEDRDGGGASFRVLLRTAGAESN